MDNESLLKNKIMDAANRSFRQNIYTYTNFLDINEQSVFANEVEMQPDPVDYGEWKSGVNTAGTLSAVNGFIGKVGMAIASSIGAALLQFGGFDAALSVQSATAQSYITTMYIWVPIVMNIATIITMMFYNLDKIYPQIIKELDERRAA